MFIISCDPSGNWSEGKGTTGLAVFDTDKNAIVETDIVTANSAECAEGYWFNNIEKLKELFNKYPNAVMRLEDYVLYRHKANNQINSHMETPMLIGCIRLWAYNNGITVYIRTASTVKNRWTDEILEHTGYLKKLGNSWVVPGLDKPLTLHERDAIRHAVACYYFDLGERK